MPKPLRLIVEAKRPVYKRKGSLRARVKSKTTIAKEKADRMRSIKAAIRQAKETGEKPQIGTRGNQRTWKAARKSAKK